jgi:ATP-binding cassette subfamily B protein
MKLKTVFFRLMKALGKRFYLYTFAILIMTMSSAAMSIVTSYVISDIINAAQTGDVSDLPLKIGINTALGLLSVILWRQSTVCYNVEAKRGIAKLERSVFMKSMKLPMDYYEKNHSGDFMSKLIYDTTKAGDIYGSRLRRLVAPILSVITFLIPMLLLCWQLTLCLVMVNVITFFINGLFIKPMKNLGTVLSKKNGIMTEKLTNLISGIDLTRIFSAGDQLVEKYEDTNKEFYKTQKKVIGLSATLDSMNEGFSLLSALCFLAVGVLFVSKGYTTLGSLAAIYSMYGVFSWHFLQIGRYMPELTNCLANAQRIFEFIDQPEEPVQYNIEGVKHDQTVDNAAAHDSMIEFDHVSFGYNEDRKILQDFKMTINRGSTVALTGESGKGKSTIAKLLLGFYQPDAGQISINGKAYGNYTLQEIRSLIAYVPQEPYLYGVSIAENISYGKPEATREEIIEAAKAANAHDFIMNLDQGYDTIAGERGNRLSGGEKQRIAIARAILKNAPILLLDEATSALDNESERLVNEAIDRLMHGRTTLMIAHRPSTIARADVVIQL